MKNAWLPAGLLLWAAATYAQSPPGVAPAISDRPVNAPAGGRNSFIAPVVDIRIQDQGLALPKGLEEPAIPAPAQAPSGAAKPEDAKSAPPATAK